MDYLIEKGEKVGVLEVVLDGEVLETIDVISKDSVYEEQKTQNIIEKKEGFFTRLFNFILKFFLYT